MGGFTTHRKKMDVCKTDSVGACNIRLSMGLQLVFCQEWQVMFGDKPPLCKGRWQTVRFDGGVVADGNRKLSLGSFILSVNSAGF